MKKRKDNKNLTGIFNANSKGYGFIKIPNEEKEIFIAPKNTKGALNEDEVEVCVFKTAQNGKNMEGKIIKILSHNKDEMVGTFKKSRNFGFVIPDDKKFGTDIYISKSNSKKISDNQKVVVKILKYPEKGKKAEGEIKEVLGNVNAAGVDMLSVIKEFGLPSDFPDSVTKELEYVPTEIDLKDLKGRTDLRNKEIFTIDGEDAKDLDDAVCVEKTADDNYVLSVHIADVSNYVKEGSTINAEAIYRGTSVYMFDRVIPMLPVKLSNGICSLNVGTDRLTLSITMEIDKKGNVISSNIYKGVINVTKRMTYNVVAKLINLDENNVPVEFIEYKDYIKHFKLMKELSDILKEKRLHEGSLDLDIPESKIILDENGIAIDVKKYEITPANEIIEQFMLKANEQIAEKFFWLEAPFIYRVHEIPDMEKVDELNKFLFNLGYRVKATKDNIHPKAFSEVLNEIKDKPEERVISNLVLRTLKLARYENENKGHFGLASKFYCHFTSPIRRYPDLFIHRVISKYINSNYNLDELTKDKFEEQAKKYADSSSEREKVAQKAEREAEYIKKAEFMQNKIGEIYEGIISSITSFGIFVELENTVEGMIRFDDLGREYYIYDEDRKQLIGERTKEVFKIGDKITIQVTEANKALKQINFKRVVINEENSLN